MAASDILLQIKDVIGESAQKADCIDIESFSWGVSNSGSFATGGGGGGGKYAFQDLHLVAADAKAAPTLMKFCATGQHIDKVSLHLRKAGGGDAPAKEYYTLELENCLISSYQSSAQGHGGIGAMDSFSINFAKIHYVTKLQDAKGEMTAGGDTKFDLKTGKA